MSYCTNCGQAIGPDQKFCTSCGAIVATGTPDETNPEGSTGSPGPPIEPWPPAPPPPAPPTPAPPPPAWPQRSSWPQESSWPPGSSWSPTPPNPPPPNPPPPGPPARRPGRGVSGALFAGVFVLVLLAIGAVVEGPNLLHHSHSHSHHVATSPAPSTTATPAPATTTSSVPATTTTSSVPATTTTTVPKTTTTQRHHSSTKKSTEPTAKSVASQLSTWLSQSEADRGRVLSAAGELSSCTNLDSADAAFDASIRERQHLESAIGGTNVAALPGGGTVKSDFLTFLRASAADDRVLATWTSEKISGGCSQPPPTTTNQLNDAATAAKETFVAAWNPVAGRYGLPSVSEAKI